MAVIHRDHLSSEVGHSAGIDRIVLGLGLVLVGVGVVAFLLGLALGMNEARGGVVDTDGVVWLLPAGSLSVILGLVISSIGMALARRSAGE